MPRFEIESKQTHDAHEDQFAEYTAWLRDSEHLTVETFTGPTRDSVKAQAIARARTIKPPRSEDFGFVCAPVGYGQLGRRVL